MFLSLDVIFILKRLIQHVRDRSSTCKCLIVIYRRVRYFWKRKIHAVEMKVVVQYTTIKLSLSFKRHSVALILYLHAYTDS